MSESSEQLWFDRTQKRQPCDYATLATVMLGVPRYGSGDRDQRDAFFSLLYIASLGMVSSSAAV